MQLGGQQPSVSTSANFSPVVSTVAKAAPLLIGEYDTMNCAKNS